LTCAEKNKFRTDPEQKHKRFCAHMVALTRPDRGMKVAQCNKIITLNRRQADKCKSHLSTFQDPFIFSVPCDNQPN